MKRCFLKLLISLITLFFAEINILAQNLVPNPGFEDSIGTLPCFWTNTGDGDNIETFLTGWFQPTNPTTDLFSNPSKQVTED